MIASFSKSARLLLPVLFIFVSALACGKNVSPFPDPTYTPEASIFQSNRTAYGFFPSPPEISMDSLFATYQAIGKHADLVLIQENIPWLDFVKGVDVDSQRIVDLKNRQKLALANNLDSIYVIDPLNGLNRREFAGLPDAWGQADFSTPEVRSAYLNFSLRVLREFKPRYLGLGSEVNSYAEAHPDDFPDFLSLYRETYAAIKAESPETQVFVTFQWEQLNGLGGLEKPEPPFQTRWEQIEIFEPQLDLWVISSYPFVAFPSGSEIPVDYYSPLLAHTNKPLAVAEGGFISRPAGNFSGTPQDQVDYLNAIHTQLGRRLNFWIYLQLSDINLDSYTRAMRQQGAGDDDVYTLGFFVTVGLSEKDGTPKPALLVWDSYRSVAP